MAPKVLRDSTALGQFLAEEDLTDRHPHPNEQATQEAASGGGSGQIQVTVFWRAGCPIGGGAGEGRRSVALRRFPCADARSLQLLGLEAGIHLGLGFIHLLGFADRK